MKQIAKLALGFLFCVNVANAGEEVIQPYRISNDKLFYQQRLVFSQGDSYLSDFMIRLMKEFVRLSDLVKPIEIDAFIKLSFDALAVLQDTLRTLPEQEREVGFLLTRMHHMLLLEGGRGYSFTTRNALGRQNFAAIIERIEQKTYDQWAREYADLLNNLRQYSYPADFEKYVGPVLSELNMFGTYAAQYGPMHTVVYQSFQRLKAKLTDAEPLLSAIAQSAATNGFRDILSVRRKILSFTN